MQIKAIALGSTRWQRFIRRWGVSFLIDEDILFDTLGKPKVSLNNLKKFKVNLPNIKHIIISHDDWDHISGLWYLLPNQKDVTVYICFGFKQEIKQRIISFGVKLIEVKDMLQIKEKVYSTGELYAESEGRKIYEQSLVIDTGKGLGLICGCAHMGIVNIVKYVRKHFQKNIYWLIGGFHLKNNTDEENSIVIKQLKELGVSKIVPTHCTGKRAIRQMCKIFDSDVIQIKEGDIIEL
ncbi:MAG: MBL fold metallo-hydrolase [Candidatus Omnitrophica bacterium]|nr:MBL fold metallo-hydrolase [Candidatus Omnitrophota bacterium]